MSGSQGDRPQAGPAGPPSSSRAPSALSALSPGLSPANDAAPALPTGLPEVLTVADLAALLRVNRKTVYAELAAGRIPGVRRVGARRPVYRAHRDTVLAWLAGQDQQVRPSRGRR